MRRRAGVAFALLLAFGMAGCGGADGGDGVATAGGKASASAKPGSGDERERVLRFARCMRENGVPNFPDPEVGEGGESRLSLPEGVDPKAVEAAEKKCKQHLPNGGEPQKADPEVVEQLRRYSQCMRDNGVPKFPDPTDQGLQVNNDKLGMAPDDPRLKAAEEKCKRHMPAPPEGEAPQQDQQGGAG